MNLLVGVRGFEPPDFYLPKVALYQAELHPEVDCREANESRRGYSAAVLRAAAHLNGRGGAVQQSGAFRTSLKRPSARLAG